MQHMVIVSCIFFFLGAGMAVSELSDAESTGDGHDHTTLQESATDILSL